MNRHSFLGAQSWLRLEPPLVSAQAAVAGLPPGSQRVTAFVGAASLHISLAEQYESPQQYRGACLPAAEWVMCWRLGQGAPPS